MDKPISVGDLVVVVKPRSCCGNTDAIGNIFRVHSMMSGYSCDCGAFVQTPCASVDGYWRSEIKRLKRIPPLGELESDKNDSKLTEPA